MTSISNLLSSPSFTSDEDELRRKAAENASALSPAFSRMVADITAEKPSHSVASGPVAPSTEAKARDPKAEFLEYMEKTTAERLRDQILREKGLTEEDLAAMPPEKRAALEEEIAQRIKDSLTQSAEQEIEQQIEARVSAIVGENSGLLAAEQDNDEPLPLVG